MKDILKIVFITAFAVLAQIAPSHAEVAFTTLATSGTYSSEGDPVSGSPEGGPGLSWADPFSPTITGNLSSIDLGVSYSGFGPGQQNASFIVSLDADNPNGGPLTTDVLASGDLVAPENDGSNSLLTTFSYSGPTLTLFPGTTYWVVLSATAVEQVAWNKSTTTTSSDIYFSAGGDFESYDNMEEPMSAFQVDVTPTPEPSTGAMLAMAGIAFIVIAGNKNRVMNYEPVRKGTELLAAL
jgi:hypothetical protein